MWRQVWSREVSVPGSVLRLFLIVYYVPVLLIGLIFRPWRQAEHTELSDATDDEDGRGEPHV
jgi:hypothetical protein